MTPETQNFVRKKTKIVASLPQEFRLYKLKPYKLLFVTTKIKRSAFVGKILLLWNQNFWDSNVRIKGFNSEFLN